MRSIIVSGIVVLSIIGVMWGTTSAKAQGAPQEETVDGVYQLILNTDDRRVVTMDRLLRDRDLDAGAIYRVSTSGYLAFDEREWVKRIEFKVFDLPVTKLPEYKQFTETLVEINKRLWSIKLVLRSYDELALRLMNLCNKSEYDDLRQIDHNITQQLSIYRNLLLLRALVVNALERFVGERSCVDKFSQYRKDLTEATKRLTDLCRNYKRLERKAIQTVNTVGILASKDSSKTDEPSKAAKPKAAPK